MQYDLWQFGSVMNSHRDPHTSVFERVSEDLERGDYGLARTRLTSYVHTKGYSSELVERIGQISFEMRDLTTAGRYWLASDAEGEDVERAISAFVDHFGPDPDKLASQLPPAVRQVPVAELPPVARERLARLGLEKAFEKTHARTTESGSSWSVYVIVGALVVLLAASCLFASIGFYTVGRWLLR
jgi:hypothetical protein